MTEIRAIVMYLGDAEIMEVEHDESGDMGTGAIALHVMQSWLDKYKQEDDAENPDDDAGNWHQRFLLEEPDGERFWVGYQPYRGEEVSFVITHPAD